MGTQRNIYAEHSNLVPAELLQSLFVAELIRPSSRIWISSPWINDIDLVDNTARQFGSLVPTWPASWIRLSDVLRALLDRGADIVIVANYDQQNSEFLSRMRLFNDLYPGRMHVIQNMEVHEKGILSDNFTLDGSMNITYRGVHINQEYLGYRCDNQAIHERRLVLEERWGRRL
jgi:phosphatidylserine/phosphatidylglycerophosphate/cardiolipin synthase-like enzyme